jgi:hypothetical protein
MANDAMSTPPSVLTGWQEIASYLGKSIRTAQRWERNFKLPVRRPTRTSSRTVTASPAELDSWFVRQWSHKKDTDAGPGKTVVAVGESIQVSSGLRSKNHHLARQITEYALALAEECRAILRSRQSPISKAGNKGEPRRIRKQPSGRSAGRP